jgi:hypothetical protein
MLVVIGIVVAGTLPARSKLAYTLTPEVEARQVVVKCRASSSGACVIALLAEGSSAPLTVSVKLGASAVVALEPSGTATCGAAAATIDWPSCPKVVLRGHPVHVASS